MGQKLGLDFDGVISFTNIIKIRLIKEMYGVELTLNNIRGKKAVSTGLITNAQYNDAAIRLYNTDISLESTPVDGSIDSIIHLKEKYNISIVTSRSEKSAEFVRLWCTKNGIGDIPVMGTNNQPKTTFLQGFDSFVDDDPEKLKPLLGLVPNLYLYSWEYNMDETIPDGITRVNSWSELKEKLLAK